MKLSTANTVLRWSAYATKANLSANRGKTQNVWFARARATQSDLTMQNDYVNIAGGSAAVDRVVVAERLNASVFSEIRGCACGARERERKRAGEHVRIVSV